jgi:D-cysteine desulfhydrase
LAAKKLGMDSFLILSGDEPQVATGNLQLDLMLGAEAEYISWSEYQRSIDEYLQKRADRLKEQGRNPYIIPTGGSNGLGLVGYTEAAFEIEDQCKEQDWYPDYVICAVGSGGTYAGLLAGKLASSFTGHVLGILVCASITYFQDKIIQDFEEAKKLHNWPLQLDPKEILLNNRNIFGGYAKTSSELFQFLRYVAETEAVIVEPVYTGKAFYGLWQEIQSKNIAKGARVLFIHTGGVFGLPSFAEPMTKEWDSVHRWENRFDKG